ncbi:amino acid permease, partial [Saccharopolyspora terrae]|uniref:amino acid permease n=1 Tax=Saccharopolyspora terrae TaxID=2530384 RepID=UPI001F48BCD8
MAVLVASIRSDRTRLPGHLSRFYADQHNKEATRLGKLAELLCYSELGTRFPVAGGEYSIVARVLGRGVGWITFVMSLAMIVVVPPVIALGTAEYLSSALELPTAATGAVV